MENGIQSTELQSLVIANWGDTNGVHITHSQRRTFSTNWPDISGRFVRRPHILARPAELFIAHASPLHDAKE